MIKLENITKYYKKAKAVDNLNMEIKSGELVILIGESGCGKSTTLKLINKLIVPEEGNIYIKDKNINEMNVDKLRRSIGYVVQSVGLFPHMNVLDNICVGPKLLKWDKKKYINRAKELIDLVGLDVDRYSSKYPSELSGGEAQRIGVARALASDPEIILMDEPFGAVDPINRANLQLELLRIQKQLKKTIIFVTHDIDEAIKIGDRIAIMYKGVLQGYDTAEALLTKGDNEFIKSFMGKEAYINLLNKFVIKDYIEPSTDLDLIEISATDTLRDALALMISKSIEKLKVCDSNKTKIGEISISTIVSLLKDGR